jgi:hypothetical protein
MHLNPGPFVIIIFCFLSKKMKNKKETNYSINLFLPKVSYGIICFPSNKRSLTMFHGHLLVKHQLQHCIGYMKVRLAKGKDQICIMYFVTRKNSPHWSSKKYHLSLTIVLSCQLSILIHNSNHLLLATLLISAKTDTVCTR